MADTLDVALRKGSAGTLILSMVEARDRHGYEIARMIETQSKGVVKFHVASFYPLLYQLEGKGLIKGRWVEKPGQRRRRYYKLTAAGRTTLALQRSRWEQFIGAMSVMARLKAV